MFLRLVGLVLAFWSIGQGSAFATSCAPQGLLQQLRRADGVFEGTIIGPGPPFAGESASGPSETVRLKVNRFLKGDGADVVTVTSGGEIAGATTFQTGERWRVFGKKVAAGVYSSPACSGTHQLGSLPMFFALLPLVLAIALVATSRLQTKTALFVVLVIATLLFAYIFFSRYLAVAVALALLAFLVLSYRRPEMVPLSAAVIVVLGSLLIARGAIQLGGSFFVPWGFLFSAATFAGAAALVAPRMLLVYASAVLLGLLNLVFFRSPF